MTESALVSVIIPVYNGERFLVEALESVFAQNYTPLEIIVVDDGSTDRTAALVLTYGNRVRYIYQDNQGPAAARNRGIELAQGQFIAFQDADDIWTPTKLHVQIVHARAHPNVDIFVGQTQIFGFGADGRNEKSEGGMQGSGFFPMLQAALIRCEVFAKIGLLAEELRQPEDLDWFLRAIEAGVRIVMHQDIVILYRRHETNITNSWQQSRSAFFLALKRSLARRRQMAGQMVAPQIPVSWTNCNHS